MLLLGKSFSTNLPHTSFAPLLVAVFLIVILFSESSNGEDSSCPCLEDNSVLDMYRDPESGDLIYQGNVYPSTYGIGCGEHDRTLAPYCGFDNAPEWCSKSFCYVDPDNCAMLNYLSAYFALSGIYYSYQTCGSDGTFYEWFNDGTTDDDRPLTDVADLVENYLLTIRSSLQEDFSEFSTVSSACDSYPSCGCAECVYNSDWDESVHFSTTTLTSSAFSNVTDSSTCLAEAAGAYFLKLIAAEYQSIDHIGFAYSGFQDDGALSLWPALEWCPTNYDPRFRPWYAAAVTNPKLLIMVIDVSGSMAGTRIGLAVDAAKAILKTLAWKDRVGIVLFNSIVTSVRQPEYVTDAERDLMNSWIDSFVVSDAAGGGTSFYEPMLEALDMIDADPGCSNVVLFLTDGDDSSFTESNYATVSSRVQTNDVVLFTYVLGSGADSTIMKRIACDNDGLFYSVADGADLGSVMSSYYAYYAASISNTGVRWANFLEAATSTDIYAACTPLYDTTDASSEVSVIFGVSCIDMNIVASIDDLQADSRWPDLLAYMEQRAEECIVPWNGYNNAQILSALEYIRYREKDQGAETCDDNYNPPGSSGGNDSDEDDHGHSSLGFETLNDTGVIAVVILFICAVVYIYTKRKSLETELPYSLTGMEVEAVPTTYVSAHADPSTASTTTTTAAQSSANDGFREEIAQQQQSQLSPARAPVTAVPIAVPPSFELVALTRRQYYPRFPK